MTAAAVQPETGVDRPLPRLFSSDLGQFAFESSFQTSSETKSQEVEFKLGPPGGPYTTIASVPRKDAETGPGWVAASGDFSKLILAVEDHSLLDPESSTGTKTGDDLYEYSGGELRQLNVDSGGITIGSCGASVVHTTGEEGEFITRNAVSADSARVFFEAVPAKDCSEPKHLYMRLDGGGEDAETLDIGAYEFVEADSQGTTLLIRQNGQLFRYDTVTRVVEQLAEGETLTHQSYTYGVGPAPAWEFGTKQDLPDQIIRYDKAEHLIQCVSCASPFDPEPRLPATLGSEGGNGGQLFSHNGLPKHTVASANGDFVFFDTPAALVPQDVDGEVAPEEAGGKVQPENPSTNFSVSSDVYEWRAPGVDGCTAIQGCLALITSGRGGYLNLLLGSAEEGRDVFIYTDSQLVPGDNDTAGDIYDVRIDGGFPAPPPHPVECEGDACSTPASPPNDATPSSFTFSGIGNVLGSPSTKPATKSKKTKTTKKPKKHNKKRKAPKSKRSQRSRKASKANRLNDKRGR